MASGKHYILTINFGSTSTKLAVFEDEKEILRKDISHPRDYINSFATIRDQLGMRKEAVDTFLAENNFPLEKLTCIAARSPAFPCEAGAYRIDKNMVEFALDNPNSKHPLNLCCAVAYEYAEPLGIPAFTYDGAGTDEFLDFVRVTGISGIVRRGGSHYENQHAMGIRAAKDLGKPFDSLNLVIAHMGGGCTTCIFSKGRMIDCVGDAEGSMSPERAGAINSMELVNLCYSGKHTQNEMERLIRGSGGLVALLGTADAREVEQMIADGDERAALIYTAFAYQISKDIAAMATAVNGEVDLVILTGGIAHSDFFTKMITDRVGFVAPVKRYPGEDELLAFVQGSLRVLSGKEKAHVFTPNAVESGFKI